MGVFKLVNGEDLKELGSLVEGRRGVGVMEGVEEGDWEGGFGVGGGEVEGGMG